MSEQVEPAAFPIVADTQGTAAMSNSPDSTPTEREAGEVGVAAVIAAHRWQRTVIKTGPAMKCSCGEWVDDMDAHLAEALAPLVAERERAAGARALREAADAFGPAQISGLFPSPSGYTKAWLLDRAKRLGGDA